ncbi:MAG: LON peptidase substrate-binding domain-containing protein [Verrucomicrobia bacterium]|nr:LON peptidase substrate-binding domain-containing protein [Verrucomicrobiota bacterium]
MQLPTAVPIMTLPNVILFPQAMLPLYIFEPRYRQMLTDVLASHRMFAIAMQKQGRTRECPSGVAGLGLVRASVANRDGTSNLVLQGLSRVRLERVVHYKPYRVYRIRPLATPAPDTTTVDALTARVLDLVRERLKLGFQLPVHLVQQLAPHDDFKTQDSSAAISFKEVIKGLAKLNDPEQLADLVSCTLLPAAEERQTILEIVDLESRLKSLIQFLLGEIRRQQQRKPHE